MGQGGACRRHGRRLSTTRQVLARGGAVRSVQHARWRVPRLTPCALPAPTAAGGAGPVRDSPRLACTDRVPERRLPARGPARPARPPWRAAAADRRGGPGRARRERRGEAAKGTRKGAAAPPARPARARPVHDVGSAWRAQVLAQLERKPGIPESRKERTAAADAGAEEREELGQEADGTATDDPDAGASPCLLSETPGRKRVRTQSKRARAGGTRGVRARAYTHTLHATRCTPTHNMICSADSSHQ